MLNKMGESGQLWWTSRWIENLSESKPKSEAGAFDVMYKLVRKSKHLLLISNLYNFIRML